ncbi:MAG: hypothetical protein FJ264_18075 [Planctomycetes bacterium]|nr:hypothetical protein [Planctomycetota bacterium]MBM4066881.1 hypothetical protein [Planctomycetota bacterium]
MKIPLFIVDIEIQYHPRSRKEWMYFAGTVVSLVLCCFIVYYTVVYLKSEITRQKIEEKNVKMQPEKQEKKTVTVEDALDSIREHLTK